MWTREARKAMASSSATSRLGATMSSKDIKEMIELQVETGQLTAPAYVAQLRQAAARERAKALEYKGKPGGTAVAVAALKRLKVMQEEIDGAVKGGIA